MWHSRCFVGFLFCFVFFFSSLVRGYKITFSEFAERIVRMDEKWKKEDEKRHNDDDIIWKLFFFWMGSHTYQWTAAVTAFTTGRYIRIINKFKQINSKRVLDSRQDEQSIMVTNFNALNYSMWANTEHFDARNPYPFSTNAMVFNFFDFIGICTNICVYYTGIHGSWFNFNRHNQLGHRQSWLTTDLMISVRKKK